MSYQYTNPSQHDATAKSPEDLALLESCRNDPAILFRLPDHCWHDNGKTILKDTNHFGYDEWEEGV